jgi:hypothetical protein
MNGPVPFGVERGGAALVGFLGLEWIYNFRVVGSRFYWIPDGASLAALQAPLRSGDQTGRMVAPFNAHRPDRDSK